jgi:hypothetical protein
MQLVVLGIEQMDSGFDVMKPENLLLEGNELIAFLGIAGNGKAVNRKLKARQGLDGGSYHGVVSEDLFGFIGIGRLAPHANAGVSIVGKSGTTEVECIGRFAYQS